MRETSIFPLMRLASTSSITFPPIGLLALISSWTSPWTAWSPLPILSIFGGFQSLLHLTFRTFRLTFNLCCFLACFFKCYVVLTALFFVSSWTPTFCCPLQYSLVFDTALCLLPYLACFLNIMTPNVFTTLFCIVPWNVEVLQPVVVKLAPNWSLLWLFLESVIWMSTSFYWRHVALNCLLQESHLDLCRLMSPNLARCLEINRSMHVT